MPNRLALEGHLFPVQCFFNAVSDSNFLEVVEALLRGVGRGINDTHCQFPDDLDPGEEAFEGVRFSLFEESVVISMAELRSFAFDACAAYLASYPEERDRVRELFARL